MISEPLTKPVYIQLFDIVELLTPNRVYDVLSRDGIGPSILLFAIVNAVRLVSADQDDGNSPLISLSFNLRVVRLVRADQDDGSIPVRLTLTKLRAISHVFAAIQDGIALIATHVLLLKSKLVNLVNDDQAVGIVPVNKLSFRVRSLKLVHHVRLVGSDHSNLLYPNATSQSEVFVVTQDGIDPVKLLLFR